MSVVNIVINIVLETGIWETSILVTTYIKYSTKDMCLFEVNKCNDKTTYVMMYIKLDIFIYHHYKWMHTSKYLKRYNQIRFRKNINMVFRKKIMKDTYISL